MIGYFILHITTMKNTICEKTFQVRRALMMKNLIMNEGKKDKKSERPCVWKRRPEIGANCQHQMKKER